MLRSFPARHPTEPQEIACMKPTNIQTSVMLPGEPDGGDSGGSAIQVGSARLPVLGCQRLVLLYIPTKYCQSLTYFCLQLPLKKTLPILLFPAPCPGFLLAFHAMCLHVHSDPILFLWTFFCKYVFWLQPTPLCLQRTLDSKSLQINRKIDCTLLVYSLFQRSTLTPVL